MKSNDPYRARVVAEISIDQAVAAIEHFAEEFPADRCSTYISGRLFDAAIKISSKAAVAAANTTGLAEHIHGQCVGGRMDTTITDETGTWTPVEIECDGGSWIADETLPF